MLTSEGKFVGTFTGRHGTKIDVDNPQSGIWTLGPIKAQRGHQEFPVLSPDNTTMTISGRHIHENAHLYVNGRRVDGTISSKQDEYFDLDFTVKLEKLPEVGMHLFQIQNPDGMFSNDFIFHVVEDNKVNSQKSENAVDLLKKALGKENNNN